MPRGKPDPNNLPLRLRRAKSRLREWRREAAGPSGNFRPEDTAQTVAELEAEVENLERAIAVLEGVA
jgi:hypothetical protein